jgi:CRISPR-associated helicase Cas3 subtype I-F
MNQPFYYPLIKSIASLSGYMHDFGKANKLFQEKIRGIGDTIDIVRHEFLSFYIVLKLLEFYEQDIIMGQASDVSFITQEKWNRIFDNLKSLQHNDNHLISHQIDMALTINNDFFYFNLNNHSNPLLYCILFSILSHHVIPSALYPYGTKDKDTEVANILQFSNTNRISSMSKDDIEKLKKNITLHETYYIDESLEECINSGVKQVYTEYQFLAQKTVHDKELFFKSFSIISRILLVMSDHYVSSQKKRERVINKRESSYKITYANTNRDHLNPSIIPTFNQTLDEHLFEVGKTTTSFLDSLVNIQQNLPVLSKNTIDEIMKKSSHQDFDWQDKAVEFIHSHKNGEPVLILNMGTTGSGKTRMNVKALGALNNSELRITSVFNLKSLTLQTGHAYRKQLGLQDKDLSVLIGDKNYLDIQNINASINEEKMDNDNASTEQEYLLAGEFDANTHWDKRPDFIQNKEKNGYNVANFIGVPVLVSTIDFCINAGDLSQGTNHINAFLRIMHSDLIIDEIDSYEPEMLESVLRLITMAAMNHRNIVISSATLSEHYITMLKLAFDHGVALGNQLNNSNYTGQIFCISNLIDSKEIKQEYDFKDYINKLCTQFSVNQEKMATIFPLVNSSGNQTIPPVFKVIKQLHIDNHQEAYGKKFSFGLIRVGQIKNAIKFAQKFEKTNFSQPNYDINNEKIEVKFLTYHSNLLNSQRFIIEEFLDDVLNKNKAFDNLFALDIIKNSSAKHIIFIIIATPVEEIGRDHDFDWQIIEPSSIQSIIQTSGRANRHRKHAKNKPNIYILQYNLSYYCRTNNFNPVYFSRPGMETKNHQYEQNIEHLLPWNDSSALYITSKLRYDSKFATLDDKSISLALNDLEYKFANAKTKHWFRDEYYKSYPLRKNTGQTYIYSVDWTKEQFYIEIDGMKGNGKPIEASINGNILNLPQAKYHQTIANKAYLKTWSNQSEITIYKDKQKETIAFHPYFGFYFDE